MHSAGGRAADADSERAETYLWLAAEAALRSTAEGLPASRLMALILMADRALAPATLFFPPSDDPPDSGTPPFAQLTGTDDVGMEYRLGFSDGTWVGSAWTGTVIFVPAPPATARWLAITSPNGPLLRANIIAAPPAAATPSAVLGAVPETPGERLLTRRAEAMLAANALGYPVERGQPGQGEAVAAVEGAGVLAPLSAAPARLAALGSYSAWRPRGPRMRFRVGGREGMLRLALLPPLGHAATALTAEIRGATQQVTATFSVHW